MLLLSDSTRYWYPTGIDPLGSIHIGSWKLKISKLATRIFQFVKLAVPDPEPIPVATNVIPAVFEEAPIVVKSVVPTDKIV